MRNILFGTAAFVALCGSAIAADLPIKAAVVAAPIFSWSGFYVGGFVGGAAADRNANSTEPQAVGPAFYNTSAFSNNYSLSNSFIAGGTVGINFQPSASNWVFGVEGEVGYLKLTRTVVDINPVPAPARTADSTDHTQLGEIYGVFAGRLGYAVDHLLFYGKGGAAFVDKAASFNDNCLAATCTTTTTLNTGASVTQLTWAAGGGIEYAINDDWSVKGEYLYLATRETYSYSSTASTGIAYSSFHTDPGLHTAKIGLNYRWGGPAVGRY